MQQYHTIQQEADAEAIFEFVGFRKERIFDGYRPAHLVKEGYLTTGLHRYYNLEDKSREALIGTITFLSPEEYPFSLWIGKVIEMYEGSQQIGYAVITNILNPLLKQENVSVPAGFEGGKASFNISADKRIRVH